MEKINDLFDRVMINLQDDFGSDEQPDESANSEAPEAPAPAPKEEEEEPEQDTTAETSDLPVEDIIIDEGPTVNLYWQMSVQIINVTIFILAIFMNAFSQLFMEYDLSEVTAMWEPPISPNGWAFSIWGVIYTFFGIFVVYQALPSDLVIYRNDDMIYNQISLIFAANMFANSAWLPVFQSNTLAGFIIGEILIVFMWFTALACMVIADRNPNYWMETIAVRIPFSLYTGWLTAATLLNTTYMFKSWGWGDFNTIPWWAWEWADFMNFMTEEEWTCVTVWFAFVLFTVISWVERNPLYGGVFIWAGTAILDNLVTNKPEMETLIINSSVILGVHSIDMIVLSLYLVWEELQPYYVPISFWNGGIISNVEWYRMFEDIGIVLKYLEEFFKDTLADRLPSA